MADAPDELFTVRNNYYLGNYTKCIHEAGTLRVPKELDTERTLLLNKSYLAMNNPDSVLSENQMLTSDSPPSLRTVKLHAQLMAFPEKKEQVLADLKALLNEGSNGMNSHVQLVAATMYQSCGDQRSALRTLRNFTGGLEHLAFGVQLFLSMNLVEKANGLLKKMQQIDDDATLTQLANALVYLAVGGTKYQEAFYIFQELIDKYGETVPLLNGIAVALMHQQEYSQASSYLVTALSKSSGNPDTLVNMIVCAQLLHKPAEVVGRYLRELRKNAPDNAWLKRYDTATASFDRTPE